MNANTWIGIALIVTALTALTYLVLWSRKVINRIARSGGASAREIRQELSRGRE